MHATKTGYDTAACLEGSDIMITGYNINFSNDFAKGRGGRIVALVINDKYSELCVCLRQADRQLFPFTTSRANIVTCKSTGFVLRLQCYQPFLLPFLTMLIVWLQGLR